MSDIDSLRAAFYRRELTNMERAYRAGVLPALYDAIHLCQIGPVEPPQWVLSGMLETMEMLFAGKFAKGAGRTANPLAKYKADLIHFTRWDAVNLIREHQRTTWLEYHNSLSRPGLSPDDHARLERHAPYDAGRTWDDAYEHAHVMLKGTPSQGSPHAMKDSYQIVKRLHKDPEQAGRFYLVTWRTMRKLGLAEFAHR